MGNTIASTNPYHQLNNKVTTAAVFLAFFTYSFERSNCKMCILFINTMIATLNNFLRTLPNVLNQNQINNIE